MPKKPPARRPSAALEKYREKRDFTRTSEPVSGKSTEGARRFVVQEHHARAHHFDFRLELDGVLLSWAVPKGIPEDPAEKRLAVHVEDHPLDYADFEGVIPKGNYGAGTVAIWDKGSWEPIDKDWRNSLAKGHLKFSLTGARLQGQYLLTMMGEEPNWLMRRIETAPAEVPDLDSETPKFISPQLAKVVPAVPQGGEWLHEIKLDGYRLIAVREKSKVQLFTRTGLDWTHRFAALAGHLALLPGTDFVLDGEAVVFDSKGRTDFGALQEALKGKGENIIFIAFDLLHHAGKNLRRLPLSERLKFLETLIPDDVGPVRRSKTWPASAGADLFQQACKLGLEGIISKKSNGTYFEGLRRDWAKSKCRPRQEFVICGFTEPKNSCPAFGALVLASFDGGKLIPRGKVGTGFTDKSREALLQRMAKIKVLKSPFPAAEKNVTWIKPELVAEIQFAELTSEGSIRQGSFISLREDKPAGDVHLEAVPEATMSSKKTKDATVLGIAISHPERVVYPEDGITKLEVARYYERVGHLILPHVKNRPLAIIRAPDGISGEMFFQKSFKAHVPAGVLTKKLEDDTEIFRVNSVEGIISLAQFGAIEIHPWGATLPDVDKPDRLIWDLDPDAAVPWNEVKGTAFLLRDFLTGRGLQTVVKTSGGKGLHVVLPLKRIHGWDVMKPFSKAVASAVAEFNPKKLLVNSSIKKRAGKIYIDYLRNGRGATCIVAWGLRARKGATVSVPLDWSQLADLPRSNFGIHDDFDAPADWKNMAPQTVTKLHLKEFAL